MALSSQMQNCIFEMIVVINVGELVYKLVFSRELLNKYLWHLCKLFKLSLENISISDDIDRGC